METERRSRSTSWIECSQMSNQTSRSHLRDRRKPALDFHLRINWAKPSLSRRMKLRPESPSTRAATLSIVAGGHGQSRLPAAAATGRRSLAFRDSSMNLLRHNCWQIHSRMVADMGRCRQGNEASTGTQRTGCLAPFVLHNRTARACSSSIGMTCH